MVSRTGRSGRNFFASAASSSLLSPRGITQISEEQLHVRRGLQGLKSLHAVFGHDDLIAQPSQLDRHLLADKVMILDQ